MQTIQKTGLEWRRKKTMRQRFLIREGVCGGERTVQQANPFTKTTY